MSADVAPTLTLYSRNYCHLCDEMIAGLRELQAANRFEFEIIDVDRDPAFEQLYGEKVPVLAYGGRELCHYFLDRAALTALLAEIR